jgi:predicted RNase H-like nuclease
MSVVGIDGCSSGWFAVEKTGSGECHYGQFETIQNVWERFEGSERMLIDIPIGLPADGERQCDGEARDRLGCRGSSVFTTPCREAIEASNHEAASERQAERTGKRVSVQAWSLAPKIRNVNEFLRNTEDAQRVVQESHPELCFYAFNHRNPIAYSKNTKRGRKRRKNVLSEQYAEICGLYEDALNEHLRKHVARDDVLDAFVLAAAAAEDELRSLPEETNASDGELPMEIVYPHPR